MLGLRAELSRELRVELLFEIGLELRYRITEEIGIVPFVEGGQVWDGSVPDSSGELRWAAGLGLRYHTAIGPVRIDVAMPINRRKNIDDAFQLYFSLGQAF
jgi:translocation and assembly module TamA